MRRSARLTWDETVLLSNALNDLINAVRWSDDDLENALGLPIESLRELLDRLEVLYNGFGRGVATKSTSGAAELAVRSNWRPDYRDESVGIVLEDRDREVFCAALDEVMSGHHFSEAAFHPRMGVDPAVAQLLRAKLQSSPE